MTDRKQIRLVLCIVGFFGFAGLHRFYDGQIATGFLWFFTGGLFGIGQIYDLVMIIKYE